MTGLQYDMVTIWLQFMLPKIPIVPWYSNSVSLYTIHIYNILKHNIHEIEEEKNTILKKTEGTHKVINAVSQTVGRMYLEHLQ